MDVARSERFHVAILGRRNAGKSSLMNALLGQQVSIVSEVAGTTTDVVMKNVELPHVGAAVLMDTAGYDDVDEALGQQRVEKTKQAMLKADAAILVVSGEPTALGGQLEVQWIARLNELSIPHLVVLGKIDELVHVETTQAAWHNMLGEAVYPVVSHCAQGIEPVLQGLATIFHKQVSTIDFTAGLVSPRDVVVLVMPQDVQAPQGRIIKPQVETLRNLLDKHCRVICVTPHELASTLDLLKSPPQVVITDSQAFATVAALCPGAAKLTSFSVLMAHAKGDISTFVKGAQVLQHLPADARILIAEACNHIPQNEDIGRVKLPALLRRKLGDDIHIDIVGGNDFPHDLAPYSLIIHCGACMFNRRHVLSRIRLAAMAGVPITNYGIAIAALTGILSRVSVPTACKR